MSTTSREIEIGDDLIEVEFEGDCTIENDGIGPYEYWGHKCYDEGHNYAVCEDIEWDRTKYTADQNTVIEQYIDDNFKSIAEDIEQRFTDDYEPNERED